MVLLTLKNLQQQTFQVEIDISASVKELKEKIEKDRGKDYPAVGQKLIYAGKILQDDNKLESYSMDVNKFLVIMVTKPKTSTPPPEAANESMDTTPATATTTAAATAGSDTVSTAETSCTATPTVSTPSSSTIPSTTSTSTTTEPSSTATAGTTTTSTTSTTTTSSTEGSGAAATSDAESLLVMGDEFNKMVENIMEMGYERREVERALRASFNNPYTAVQYLVDGIPDNVGDPDPPSAGDDGGDAADAAGVAGALAAAAAAVAGEGAGTGSRTEGSGDGGSAGGGGDDPLAFLRDQPQFVQMAQMMRSNPQLLDAFLQQIRTTNPSLLAAIQNNQEAFVRMINSPQGGSGAGSGGSGGAGDADAPAAGGGGGGGGGSGRTTIMLTQQDRDAIDRLRGLGNFPEDLVVQAYFACEKNENLAAEFLFSQAWD